MEATYENLMAKVRELHKAGDIETAKRVAAIALQRKSSAVKPLPEQEPSMSIGDKAKGSLANYRQGLTMGFYDEAKAGLGTVPGMAKDAINVLRGVRDNVRSPEEVYQAGLEKERSKFQDFREKAPVAAGASEIAGALLPALATMGAGAPASTPALARLGGKSLLGRSAASGAQGAAAGGVYGFGSGEGGALNRLQAAKDTAKTAGAFSAAIPVVGSAAGKIANKAISNRAMNKALQNAPSTDELKIAARAADDAIDFTVPAEKVRSKTQEVMSKLDELGIDKADMLSRPGYTPMTPMSNSLRDLMESVQGPLDYAALKTLRRQGANAAASSIPTDRKAGMIVKEAADDLIEFAGADNKTVNALWQKMYKSQMMEDIFDSTDGYLAGDTSAIRNQFGRILKNKRLRSQFTEQEQNMMSKVVSGTASEKLIRALGSGLGQYLSPIVGASVGSPGGVSGMLIGGIGGSAISSGARKVADKITLKNAEKLHRLTAIDSPSIAPKINKSALRKIEKLSVPSLSVGVNQ